MSPLPTIGCYVRIAHHTVDASVQRDGIAQWLREQKIEPSAAQWFEDVEQGNTCNYPACEALNEAVLAGRIGTVVVWSLECLFSRLKEAVGILAFLCGRGVRVVSVVQKIDLSESAGSTLVPVMLSLMEIEEIYRRKQQAAGITAAKERGVYRGRKPGATKAEPQMIQVLKKRGLTVPQISSMFNVSERTVRRYLRITEQS